MLESNLRAVNDDMKLLINDAQALFQAAASLTGDKADELRSRGMRLLDAALLKAQNARNSAIASGNQIAASADGFVKENPWRVMATTAGVALLVGMLLGCKHTE